MTKTFKVKEFSELTGVTIRSLHHYDAIDLLKPSFKSDSGYRLYSLTDMVRLQQILTLKFIGVPLKNIKALLDAKNVDLLQALNKQTIALKERARDLNLATKLLEQMVESLSQQQQIHWQDNLKLIKVIKMQHNDTDQWCKDYLSEDEYSTLQHLKGQYDEAYLKKYHQRWNDLMAECAKHKHEDPAGEIGQQLAKQGWALIKEVWGDNLELSQKLWNATKAGAAPSNDMQADDKTLQFFDRAIKCLHQKKS